MQRKPGFQDRKPELTKLLDLGFQRWKHVPALAGEERTDDLGAWRWAYSGEGRQMSKLYAEDIP